VVRMRVSTHRATLCDRMESLESHGGRGGPAAARYALEAVKTLRRCSQAGGEATCPLPTQLCERWTCHTCGHGHPKRLLRSCCSAIRGRIQRLAAASSERVLRDSGSPLSSGPDSGDSR
jgi:hypothetical protein